MKGEEKYCTLYYNDLSLPFSPALLTISEVNSGPYLMYLKEGHKDGKIILRAWGVEKSEEAESHIRLVRERFGLDKEFVLIGSGKTAEYLKTNPDEISVMQSIVGQAQHEPLYDSHTHIVKESICVDFWNTHLYSESRPYYMSKGAESFTFNALKLMWKTLGKSGHSNKSKADLFEGFAETAVEMASSNEADTFLSKLPKRMIVASHNRRGYNRNPDVDDVKKALALISRVSAGTLFASDSSPDIDEKNVIENYLFTDLKDPYAEEIERKADNEMSAMESLKNMYLKKRI